MKRTLSTFAAVLALSTFGCHDGAEDAKAPDAGQNEANGPEQECDGPHGDGPHGDGPHGGGPHCGGPRGEGPHGGPHAPPPEAFTACEGKAAKDACSVQLGDKSVEGTCEAAPEGAEDTRLSCRSAGGPPPGGHPPGPPHDGGPKGDAPAAE